MTPLELLAVGAILVMVWCAGVAFAIRDGRGDSDGAVVVAAPFLLGVLLICWSLIWIIGLGIKEAAK